jgi:hypothetical protein
VFSRSASGLAVLYHSSFSVLSGLFASANNLSHVSYSNLHWAYVIGVLIYMGIISGPAGGARTLGWEKEEKKNNPWVMVARWAGMVRPARFSSIASMGVLWALEDFMYSKLRLSSKCLFFFPRSKRTSSGFTFPEGLRIP